MAITRYYKIINPDTYKTVMSDNQDMVGNYGMYGNYSWYHRLIQGSSTRLLRYKEYDMMDMDTDVSRALDIIAEEVSGNNPKNDLPIKVKITTGEEQTVSSKTAVTLNAALKTWCNIHKWNIRLFPTIRKTLKYGDVFFVRGPKKNRKPAFLHPKNVLGAIVTKDDITDIKGWQVRTDFKEINDTGNQQYSILKSVQSQTYNTENIDSNKVLRFTLSDDMSDEAPFGFSILQDIYITFKKKQLLEDAVIIYRIQRAPEKRVFNIEMGKVHPLRRAQQLENFKNEIKQKKIPTAYGGKDQVESIYNPMSQNEDFFFAKNNGVGTTVDVLPAGQGLGELKELDYFYQKLWRGLRIPQSYMDNSTEGGSVYNDGKVGIAYQQEIKFTLYIERLQKHFEESLDKEFKKFLHDNNINIDPTIFKIELPSPSNFKKSRDQEIDTSLINTASSADSIPYLSKRFIAKKYLQLTENELLINERMKREELGLDVNGGKKDMAKIYSPEIADEGGFGGGLTSGGSEAGPELGPLEGEEEGMGENELGVEGNEENLNTNPEEAPETQPQEQNG